MKMNVKNFIKSWSISGKLSILYTLTSLAMLVLFSIYSYLALVSILDNTNDQFLLDEIRVLRNIMVKHPENRVALETELDWIPEEWQDAEFHYYARISDQQKQKIIETQGMTPVLNGADFPPPTSITEWPKHSIVWRSGTGRRYLLMSAWASLGKSTEKMRLINIALDISQQDKILAQYRLNLFSVFVFGVLIAAGLALIITKKGMKSLQEITEAAEKITVDQLDKKFDAKDWPIELQNLVEAFNKMLTRIDTAFSRLSHFSTELAHELRTPINNLMGEAETTLSRDRSVAEYKEVLASSLEEYNKLSRIIESILFLARTENPQAILKLEKINIAIELNSLIEFYDAVAEEKNIKISFKGNATISVEPLLFRRAISNIISNALKFSPSGSTIHIDVKKKSNKKVHIAISDSGKGIAKEHLPKLFDRFYRAHLDYSQTGGVGLGLAIVKSIMELHGGDILIESEPHQGTTVTLIFPSLPSTDKNK